MNIKEIKDIKIGDEILGSDNKFHKVTDVTPIKIAQRMFRIEFSNGNIECDGDHQWTYYDSNNNKKITDTLGIFVSKDIFTKLDFHFGTEDGPIILDINEINPKEVMCITVDNKDHLFTVLTDKNEKILTHNCGFRMVCGRLGGVASLMALGNSMATAIDGKHPGAGMISSQGVIDNIQYYFEEHAWLERWFHARGLNNLGYLEAEEEDPEENAKVLESLEGDEDLESSSEVMHIEFAGVEGDVDKKQDQKFEEI